MPPCDTAEEDDALAGKACFDDIYDRDDPRAYYAALRPLAYQIPHHAQQVAQSLMASRQRPETIVDLCCSYGVNTALLSYDITLDDLYEHYATESESASTAEVIEHDLAYLGPRRRRDAPRTIGLDLSAPAIAYAQRAGLLDAGFAENLEANEPTADLRQTLSAATLVTVSGGVGYIGRRTFERVVGAVSEPPWVVALVLREVTYDPIAAALADFGLVTERLPVRTFRQRRFADAEEQQAALKQIDALGLSAVGLEETGWYHAELFVSRPESEAGVPLTELLPPV